LIKAELGMAKDVVLTEVFQCGWTLSADRASAVVSLPMTPVAVVRFLHDMLVSLLDDWHVSVLACKTKDNRGECVIPDYTSTHGPADEDDVILALARAHVCMKEVAAATVATVCS
jgi:hypothetical protein